MLLITENGLLCKNKIRGNKIKDIKHVLVRTDSGSVFALSKLRVIVSCKRVYLFVF